MSIETNYKEFSKQMKILQGKNRESDQLLTYDDAADRVKEAIKPEIARHLDEEHEDKDKPKKKEDLRRKKSLYEDIIRQAVYSNSFDVVGYSNLDQFIDDMVEDIAGHSVLSKAFADPGVDDIFCLAWDDIYVEKNGVNEVYSDPTELVEAVDEQGQPLYEIDEEGNYLLDSHGNPMALRVPKPITFRSPRHYQDFVERLLGLTGKGIDNGTNKIVDAEFYEDRLAVTSKSVSPTDISLTIRKHREDHLVLDDIVRGGVMNEEIADTLGTIVLGESNLIYAGITGSGKTTTLRAILDFFVSRANKRMLVVEDTQELFPQNPHTLELVTSKTNDPTTNVSLRDLIMTALRLKPKYIIVGEVRGEEAEAAVEAMETGHSTAFTMHGATPWNIVNRLVNKYLMQMPSLSIDVVERIIGSSVDYIAIQDAIPGIGRKVTSISEVTYDFKAGRVVLVPIYEFDFETEEFVQINKLSPDKGTQMMRRGIPIDVIKGMVREEEAEFIPSLREYKLMQKSQGDVEDKLNTNEEDDEYDDF